MPSTPPHIGYFKRESTLKLALHGQIHSNGIGGFKVAIDPIGVERKSGRVRVIWGSCRITYTGIGRRKNIGGHARPPYVSRSIIWCKNIGRCRLRAGQSERAKLAEPVYNSFAKVIVVHADASPDGGLSGAAK